MNTVTAQLRAAVSGIRIFESQQTRRQFLVHAAMGLLLVFAVTLLVRRQLVLLTNPQDLRLLIREFGILGPLVLVALQALQVVVAPVPGQVLAVVAGYLYGAWWGTFYNMLGITLGSTAAFWLSRRYGRPYVEKIVHDEMLAKFDAIDDHHQRLALFVMFLVPGLPDDAICFVGGLTRLPLWQLVVLAVVGRAPGFFLVNVIGEYIEAGRFGAATALAVGLAVIAALCYRYRERLFETFTLR